MRAALIIAAKDLKVELRSKEMLSALGLDANILPRVYESPEITGEISRETALVTGLKAGTPVVGGGGDQAASAVGNGIVSPGLTSATLGTSGVIFAYTDAPKLDPKGRIHTFCHAVPGKWHVMGVTQGAGLSLRWFRDNFGESEAWLARQTGVDPYDLLIQEAEQVPPGSAGVVWLPYLMGERTPHCDPNARAALIGLAASHGRGHIVRAIMEGVAFSLRDTLSIFSELGVPVESIRLGGGGSRSALWRQIQADVYGHAVDTAGADEGAAYGAAILAAVGIGLWPTVDAACDALVRGAAKTIPRPEVVSLMNDRYNAYTCIYPALRRFMPDVHA